MSASLVHDFKFLIKKIEIDPIEGDEGQRLTFSIKATSLIPVDVLDVIAKVPMSFSKILADENGHVKSEEFKGIKFNTMFEQHVVRIFNSFDQDVFKEFKDVTLSDFSVSLKEQIVALEYKITIKPSFSELNWLAMGISHSPWKIEVLGPEQQEMFSGKAA